MSSTQKYSLPEAELYGIKIECLSHESLKDGIELRGEYKVPISEESIPDESSLIPKHVTLVVTRASNYIALKPFSETIIFDDDVKNDGICASGKFRLNIFDHISFTEGGDYYILCSLGIFLSNVVRVSLHGN